MSWIDKLSIELLRNSNRNCVSSFTINNCDYFFIRQIHKNFQLINIYNSEKEKLFRIKRYYIGWEFKATIRLYKWSCDDYIIFKLSLNDIENLIIN